MRRVNGRRQKHLDCQQSTHSPSLPPSLRENIPCPPSCPRPHGKTHEKNPNSWLPVQEGREGGREGG